MKFFLRGLVLCLLVQVSVFAEPIDEIGAEESVILVIPTEGGEQLKAGLGAALGQILIAPSVIAQALVSQFGSNLQAVVGLLNTTHTALYVKQNASINAHANLLSNISAAHAVLLTNHTNAFLAHLDTHKEIAQNVSDAVVQAASALINSTVNLASSSYQTHISVAQLIINATLEAKLESMNASSVAHQTILHGVGTLLEQKMLAKQLFYGNISMVIQNITNATVFDLQAKVNQTLLKLEYFDNKTLIACDALTGVMLALTDAKNTSALSFVGKTTVFLDTIADIVNATHNISSTFFANKTGTLLQSVADVFDILANASVVRHEAFVNKFNTSVIAFSDAIVGVKEATGYFKANVTANFADKVSSLLESKSALHSNVTRDLNYLVGNLTEKISIKVNNLTSLASHKFSAAPETAAAPDTPAGPDTPAEPETPPETRQANPNNENIWFSILIGFFDGINIQFQQTINATTAAFQGGVQVMQQQITAIGQSAELTAQQINAQLNATIQSFACAQVLIPEYIRIFTNSAMRPITCSNEALSMALTTAMSGIEKIQEQTRIDMEVVLQRFRECQQTPDTRMCSPQAAQEMALVTSSLAGSLATFAVQGLPDAFITAKCHDTENSQQTFAALQEKIQSCTN